MSAPIVDLSIALKAALETATGKTFNRAYVPANDVKDLVAGKWFVIAYSEEITKKKFVDQTTAAIRLAYQRTLPAATSSTASPNNLTFIDGCMTEVESIKALFREGGALADIAIGGWVITGIVSEMIYDPESLLTGQLFQSSIRLEFIAD